jgi:hypothetical protein
MDHLIHFIQDKWEIQAVQAIVKLSNPQEIRAIPWHNKDTDKGSP